VLRSWAVPKGMPVKEGDRRTGFATEDHPIEYLDFEGTIPKGEYGGGTVMVWDIGVYEVVEGNYFKGSLLVSLKGKKLSGEWLLERQDERRWLITKTGKDNKAPARKVDLSALSGRTLEQIGAGQGKVWRSNRAENDDKQKLPRAEPEFVTPMMASPVTELPEGDEWLYELKLDGYRVLAIKEKGRVQLLSRNNKNLTRDYPEVAKAVERIHPETAVLDGEVVMLDSAGRPSFQMLQNRGSLGKQRPLVYYAFDLLNTEGRSLLALPLDERKRRLAEALGDSGVLFSANLSGKTTHIIEGVRQLGLEGVIAKRRDSQYQPGKRTGAWQKLKLSPEQEFVIGGYKPGFGNFEQLVVGYYDGDKLLFAGRVRAGFTPASRAGLWRRLKPLEIAECPFANLPNAKKSHWGEGVTAEDMKKLRWLKPNLVAQIAFTEWTREGALRHSEFVILRQDKDPNQVVRETEQ
jgi:bifunctional non-homologous end joining protein LigD